METFSTFLNWLQLAELAELEEELIICLQGFGTTEENTQPMVIATYRLNWHRGELSEKIS